MIFRPPILLSDAKYMPDAHPGETRQYQSFTQSKAQVFRKYHISKFYHRTSLRINKYILESAGYNYHSCQGVLQMSKVVYAEMDVRPWSM